jgi:Protein of unknown function (DUF3689)
MLYVALIQVLLRSLVLTLESPALCSLKTECDSRVHPNNNSGTITASATASYLGTSWMDVRAVPLTYGTKLQSTDETTAAAATATAATGTTKQSTVAAATAEQVQELAAAWQARQQSAAAAAAVAVGTDGASQQPLPHKQLQEQLLKYLSCSAPAAPEAAASVAATTAAAADDTTGSASTSDTATPSPAVELKWVLCSEHEAPPGLSRLHQYLQQNLADIVRDCMAVVDLTNIEHENICTLNTVLALLVLARARGGDAALASVLAAVRSGTTTAVRHVPRSDVHGTECIPTAPVDSSGATAGSGTVRTGSEVSMSIAYFTYTVNLWCYQRSNAVLCVFSCIFSLSDDIITM